MLFILKCNGNVTGCLGDGRLFFFCPENIRIQRLNYCSCKRGITLLRRASIPR